MDGIWTFISAHGGVAGTVAFLALSAAIAIFHGALGALGKAIWKAIVGGKAPSVKTSIESWPQAPLQVVMTQPAVPVPPRITSISYVQIEEEMKKAKPLQRDLIAKGYIGLYVRWETTFYNASREQDGTLRLNLSMLEMPVSNVIVKVKEDDYRELFVADRGHRINVTGRISQIGGSLSGVSLEDATLEFPTTP